jgi:hypothetical protein
VISTFGFSLDDEEMAAVQATLAELGRLIPTKAVSSTVAALAALAQRDLAIIEETGRWDVDAPLRDEYVPGDVVGIRVRYAAPQFGTAAALLQAGATAPPLEKTDVPAGLSVAVGLYEAACYFLPVTSAVGIMGSFPPSASDLEGLRLPFPVVAVFFGADLAVPEELLVWPPELLAGLAESRHITEPLAAKFPEMATKIAFGESIVEDVVERGGWLTGVVLFADQDFALADVVGFLLATDGPKPGAHDRWRGMVAGRLSRSTLAPLIHNLAAAVAWGNWHPPEIELALPGVPGSPPWRSAARRGQFRRKEPRGALATVRVLDTDRMFRRPTAPRAADGHASPVAHLRRGYWQRHRLGPQEDWHYELRFHPPVIVNPAGPGRSRITVYRLPLPPQGRDSEVPLVGEDS